jgi:glycosyltransferase involved in cell wall biosynthesis
MVPVEAQAAGRPVIAFAKGGALETVVGAYQGVSLPELATGIFFHEQSPRSLAEAMLKFEAVEHRFSPQFIQEHVAQFDKRHFIEKMNTFIAGKLAEHQAETAPRAPTLSFVTGQDRS